MTHEKHDSSGALDAATANQKGLPTVPDTEEEEKKKASGELGAVEAKTRRGPMEHFLKCWPEFFDALLDGSKPFEVRKNDRDFRNGDTLDIHEFIPFSGGFTGRALLRRVTYVLEGSGVVGTQFGVQSGYVVMGLAPSVPERPKSSTASEFSQILTKCPTCGVLFFNGLHHECTPEVRTSLETGGRNALNLQMAWFPVAEWIRDNGWLESRRWPDQSAAWFAMSGKSLEQLFYEAVDATLQDARAASDGKEQEQDLGKSEAQ